MIRILLVLLMIALIATIALSPGGRDKRIDPLVDFRGSRVPIREAAIEPEVAEAELAECGKELIPGLRAELRAGSWRRSKWLRWAGPKLPGVLWDPIAKADFEQTRRSEMAALTLGRLGPQAAPSIQDLQSMAISARSAADAQVALTMIQVSDATVQSNAIASLTTSSQISRLQFALHAYEIWPSKPDVLDRPLRDSDETVRAYSLSTLIHYGARASNAAPVLLEMLEDPSPTVRPRAALALGLVAPEHGPKAVAVMLDQQRTNNMWTGDYAYVLYQALGPVAKAAVPKLETDLADPKMAVFHGDIAGALWRINSNAIPQIVTGLSTGVRIGVQRTQLRCLRILREIGPAATAALPAVTSVTNHPRILIRKLSRETLASINAPSRK